jgi:hypothetical protein
MIVANNKQVRETNSAPKPVRTANSGFSVAYNHCVELNEYALFECLSLLLLRVLPSAGITL